MPLILIYDIILISMKRIFTIFTLLFAVLFSSNDVSAQSLSDLLRGLGQGQSESTSGSDRKSVV